MTTPITIAGNLTGDPELRVTGNGAAVTNFTVAVNERKQSGDQWVDDGATFYRVSVWRDQAEAVADKLTKGQRVIVTGGLRSRTWTDNDGAERLSFEVTADEVGPSLRWANKRQPATTGAGRGGQDPWA